MIAQERTDPTPLDEYWFTRHCAGRLLQLHLEGVEEELRALFR